VGDAGQVRSRAVLGTLVAVLAAGVLVFAGLSSAGQTATPRGSQLSWAMAGSSLEHLIAADPTQARAAFDSPDTMVQNDPPSSRDPSPRGWSTSRTERWASFAAFRAAVEGGAVPAMVQVVHYDNESWSQTPLREQRHPGVFEKRFCDLAHANGWSCYTGPGQDLCGAISHPAGETYAQCYLDENLAGKAARYADVIDIQAQALEPRGARAYGHFVRRAAAQAKAANPDVVVLGNISASPDGATVDAAAMYSCAKAALPYVSGFYTTVSAADGSITASFLRHLDA
jgi:hypothetical protein